jgi:membrane protein implicated in regulation of membrane protease activity
MIRSIDYILWNDNKIEKEEGELMSRIFIFELPFNYTLYLSSTELLFWGLILCIVFVLIIKSFFMKVQGGREGLVGKSVVALDDFSRVGENYEGQVFCVGEIWSAKADIPIQKGYRSTVSSSEGLKLFINTKHK